MVRSRVRSTIMRACLPDGSRVRGARGDGILLQCRPPRGRWSRHASARRAWLPARILTHGDHRRSAVLFGQPPTGVILAAHTMSLNAGSRLGPYELVAPLGEGGPASARGTGTRELRRGLAVAR